MELKFKAWDKIAKKIMDVERIDFHHLGHVLTVTVGGEAWSATRFELLQWTGLKDKDGREIYDGHILRADDGIKGRVYWVDGSFDVDSASADIRNVFVWSECQIIGNVFENPELVT